MKRDTFGLTDQSFTLNLVLRATTSNPGTPLVLGFALDLPPEMAAYQGDIQVVVKCVAVEAHTRPCPETIGCSHMAVLSMGIPAFEGKP